MRRLPDLHFADLALGHKSAQIHLGQIQQRDDGGARRHHLARLGGARHHGAVKRRPDRQVIAVVLRFSKLRLGLLRLGGRAGDFSLLLRDLVAHHRDLRLANIRI